MQSEEYSSAIYCNPGSLTYLQLNEVHCMLPDDADRDPSPSRVMIHEVFFMKSNATKAASPCAPYWPSRRRKGFVAHPVYMCAPQFGSRSDVLTGMLSTDVLILIKPHCIRWNFRSRCAILRGEPSLSQLACIARTHSAAQSIRCAASL